MRIDGYHSHAREPVVHAGVDRGTVDQWRATLAATAGERADEGLSPRSAPAGPRDVAATKLAELLLAHSLREMLPEAPCGGKCSLALDTWRGFLGDAIAREAAPVLGTGLMASAFDRLAAGVSS